MAFNEHKKILKDLKRFEAKVPKMVSEMGAIGLNHFTQSFSNQGFTNETFSAWKRRKNKDTKRGKYQYYQEEGTDDRAGKRRRVKGTVRSVIGRGILIGKGTANLRKLRKLRSGRYSIDIKSNPATDKYARVHNEGLRAGRGKGFKMPKRQFVGFSRVMNDKIVRMINRTIATL